MLETPTLFVCHGAGPSFFVDFPFGGDPKGWHPMADWLRGLLDTLPERPKSVLAISGHHVEAQPTVTTNATPQQLDLDELSRFPVPLPDLTFAQKGDPRLAEHVLRLLSEAGLDARADRERGLDHGAWMPLFLADPEATLPVVSLSLVEGLDSQTHYEIGRALAPLRRSGVLIVGSGASFHNMDLIRRAQSLGDHEWAETVDGAEAFDSWLQQTVALPEPGRAKQLTAWRTAPGADTCHDDTPDHFMPLLVAAGAATTALGTVIYRDRPAQKLPQSMFRFG